MRFSTKLSAAVLVAFCALAAAGEQVAPGAVWGRADATYRLEAPAAAVPAPPSYANRTFAQSVKSVEGGWEISVTSTPSPATFGSPLRQDWSSKAIAALDPGYLSAVRSALASSRTKEEAVLRLGLVLRAMTAYAERPDFDETVQEVSRRRTASCVGMVRIAALLLNEVLNVPCRSVIGLKAEPGGSPELLSGGALHAWLEVDLGLRGRVFFDPWFSYGWVPESYIILRIGGGLEPGDLAALAGSRVTAIWRKERIFYLPANNAKTLFWSASSPSASGTAAVVGKALFPDESPVEGTAWLENSGGRVAAALWNGNFCFRELAPGSYDVFIESQGKVLWEGSLMLGALDIRELVVYSHLEKGRRGAPRPRG
jgi:hypothetical protein